MSRHSFPLARDVSSLAAILMTVASARASDPWADRVISYFPAGGEIPGYTQPSVALGEPSRFTPDPDYPATVNPFSPAYKADQVVSIGPGGSLTLEFNEPVYDDASNPFGIDLLVFGNSGYILNFSTGRTNGALFGSNSGGLVEVSQDGVTWFAVPGLRPDAQFPTLGYSDLVDPFSTVPGSVLSDFTRPVDPLFNAAGLTFAEILAAYGGSGGGAGVDLASVGLDWISRVRISLPSDANGSIEIDGLSDVIPAPSGCVLLALAMARRTRRRSTE